MAPVGRASPSPARTPAQKPSQKRLLKDVLELEQSRDGRWTIVPVEEELTFDKGFYCFVRALQLLKNRNEGVILVGLAGASGSGKTTFCEKIKAFMPGITVISMDMYNDSSKIIDQNFDDPRLTDYDCLLANLADLRAGRGTMVPIYDFKISKRLGYTRTPVPTSRIVILEGIYALSERLRPMMDLRVSIRGGVHFDLVKRVMRDITRSGLGPEAVVEQVTTLVHPMFKAFIEPDLQTAQIRIHNSFNPFSGFMNPTYILKSKQVPPMDIIRTQLQAMALATTPAPSCSSSLPTLSGALPTFLSGTLEPAATAATEAAAQSSRPTAHGNDSAGGGPAGAGMPATAGPTLASLGGASGQEPAPCVVHEALDQDFADIYLLPPGEDPETCTTWLRMRNRDGRYSLMFEEWMVDDPFIISPRITFEVNVRILGGLMALGYEVGAVMKRSTRTLTTAPSCGVTVKVDDVANLGRFVQILGHERQRVADLGHALGLDGTYTALSYIEQVQLEQLSGGFAAVTAEMKSQLNTAGNNPRTLSELLHASPPARFALHGPSAQRRRSRHQAQAAATTATAVDASGPAGAEELWGAGGGGAPRGGAEGEEEEEDDDEGNGLPALSSSAPPDSWTARAAGPSPTSGPPAHTTATLTAAQGCPEDEGGPTHGRSAPRRIVPSPPTQPPSGLMTSLLGHAANSCAGGPAFASTAAATVLPLGVAHGAVQASGSAGGGVAVTVAMQRSQQTGFSPSPTPRTQLLTGAGAGSFMGAAPGPSGLPPALPLPPRTGALSQALASGQHHNGGGGSLSSSRSAQSALGQPHPGGAPGGLGNHSGGSGVAAAAAGEGSAVAVVDLIDAKLSRISSHVDSYQDLRLKFDTLVAQHQETNAMLQQLSSTMAQLTEAMRSLVAASAASAAANVVAAGTGTGTLGEAGPGAALEACHVTWEGASVASRWQSVALVGAGLAGGLAVGGLIMLVATRPPGTHSGP